MRGSGVEITSVVFIYSRETVDPLALQHKSSTDLQA